jgi:protein involved in polysaccharide export with SLBB domain
VQDERHGTGSGAFGAASAELDAGLSADQRQRLSRDVPLREKQVNAAARPATEFQTFIAESLGYSLPLFGYSVFQDPPSTFAPIDQAPTPASYIIGPGDELLISTWGQINADTRVTVDRNGDVFLPKVGNLNVAGVKYGNLTAFLKQAIGRVYRNFELSVALGQLRSIQVFVVGYAAQPGLYTVGALSSLINAVFASGGPTEAGSMRRIQLKRNDQPITELDLYDFLVRGDKSKDMLLQAGDVIFIPPVGAVVAVSGSVTHPGIYELAAEQSLADVIALAGGPTATAATANVTLERIVSHSQRRVDRIALDGAGKDTAIISGDLIRVAAVSPHFENAVTLRGTLVMPARVPWHEGMTIRDVIPSKEALVSPDYWLRRNALVQVNRRRQELGSQERVRTDIKRSEFAINWDYAVVERMREEDLSSELLPFSLAKAVLENDPDNNLSLRPGDVITVFSQDDIDVPVRRQSKFVRLEGEIAAAGVYPVSQGDTLRTLVARAGGLTADGYLFGAEFTRESTRALQQRRLDDMAMQLEANIERNAAGRAQSALSAEDVAAANAEAVSLKSLVERMRRLRAAGRIVLALAPHSSRLEDIPAIALEDGDRLYIPPRSAVVNVLGAVVNQNSFLYEPDKPVSAYLDQAGGFSSLADKSAVYVIRADGSALGYKEFPWLAGGEGKVNLMPGATIVVPQKLDTTSFTKHLKDWTTILYQFGLGAAALKVLD